ncbi:MAG: hypothetical protein JNL83_00525 [Myxococcales bacterium]|nr:hypothetical protein [Myxococcales bacterium]
MSASRSRSGRSRPKKKASPAIAAARAPWIRDGIDYGPARAALHDLASWALGLAETATSDWPTARIHVRNTRSYVAAKLAGKPVRGALVDDVLFTAQLLARIFDDDLGLELVEMLTIFELLELPADILPLTSLMRRAARPAPKPISHIAPLVTRVSAPPPLRLCVECGYVHEPGDHVRHRNAA